MKKKLAAISFFYFSFLITSFSQTSYKIADKEVDFEEFTKVSFKLWSRAITMIDTNKVNLKEDKTDIKTASYKLIQDSTKKIAKNKILFILIENHYLPKGIIERSFFKSILTNGLNGKIKSGDKVYVGTFDWYRNNKYVFLLNKSPLDNETQIFSLINNISSPAALQNQQAGSDIYFALDETLKFLSTIKDSLPKNILLLSDDFPNIAGQKTVDEIRNESIKSDIPIYAIGYNIGADRYSQITQDEICKPTNGAYFLSKNNDRNVCTKKISEFVASMNSNSLGKTYLVSFESKQKNAGQNVVISINENEKKLVESKIRYPFNLFQWIIANIILSVIILLGLLLLAFGIYKFIQNRKQLEIQKQIEAQEKQLQIKNAANELQQLKQQHQSQQQSSEQKFREHKRQLEEEARLEKLKQLMKAKSLIPRINYDYYEQKGQFYIDSPIFKIGRDVKSNSFHILAPSLSRNHAEIIFNENGQFIIKDTNSTNGVVVNGKKENSVVLKHGDIIKLGDLILKINL